jgi:hypothetical protein
MSMHRRQRITHSKFINYSMCANWAGHVQRANWSAAEVLAVVEKATMTA